jgi:predicted RNA-binding protein YlxR (DUF448 family)
VATRRREPVRTCVGCREEAGKRALIRLVRGPDGAVRADATGRAPGRGAYLHADAACLEAARRRRALERALKAEVPDTLWTDLPLPLAGEGRGGGSAAPG